MPPRPGSRGSLLLPDPADVAEKVSREEDFSLSPFWFFREIH